MAAPDLRLIKPDASDPKVVRLSVEAADGIAVHLDLLTRENEHLKRQNEMLTVANELMAQQRDKAERRAEAAEISARAATLKLAAHYQRDAATNESMADQIDYHRSQS